jgi:hypothetical protein
VGQQQVTLRRVCLESAEVLEKTAGSTNVKFLDAELAMLKFSMLRVRTPKPVS